MAKHADNLVTFGLLLFGLVLMATPLALWVAWTGAILIAVLVVGVAAAVLYCVLVRFERPAGPGQGRASAGPGNVPDRNIDELQRLHPFIHHHRAFGGPRFQAAMRRLKRHLYPTAD